MSALNRRIRDRQPAKTFEGGPAVRTSADKTLRRITLAAMLFEDNFYYDGKSHSDLVAELIPKCDPKSVHMLAMQAREDYNLRHMPLFLLRELAKSGKLHRRVLTEVIQRPDELGEFVSMYWKDGRQPLSNQVKRGLAEAFHKFNEYQFAKWDKNSAQIRLRDVMFLTHPKPTSDKEAELFKAIAEDRLQTPDTWEVALSGGADKRETFERLMSEKKLGALAFLRNLRNMVNAGVPSDLIIGYANSLDVSRVLPFRFLAAARAVPDYKAVLETLMLKASRALETLPGRTAVVVDVSGSMFGAKVSAKSDLDRFDAAAALSMLCRERCEKADFFTFSNNLVEVPSVAGFALVDALNKSQYHSGTNLRESMTALKRMGREYDRIIVITDEQSHDGNLAAFAPKSYLINVGAYQNGVGTSGWHTISGFSEAVFDYMLAYEQD